MLFYHTKLEFPGFWDSEKDNLRLLFWLKDVAEIIDAPRKKIVEVSKSIEA